MDIIVKDGNLLDQPVEVIVNAWNRNLIPWWLLLPQGVSGAIKRRGGYEPFRELSRRGVLPLGGAVITGAGRLPFRAIIHVAGINFLWRSSEESIRKSVRNALALAAQQGFRSLAFPLIGAGTGGGRPAQVQAIMEDEIQKSEFPGEVLLVRFKKNSEPRGTPNDDPMTPLDNSGGTEGSPSGRGKVIPAYAARMLAPCEGVRYLTRPRLLSLGMFVVMTAVVLGLVVFSIAVEPGFIRLLSLPAIPLLGGLAASLLHSPVIFVTDRRIVFARRFLKPLSLDLERLVAIRVQQNRLGRLLGYGELLLQFQPLQDLGEGVFHRITLSKLPDAVSLGSAISAAAGALGNEAVVEG